MENPRPGSQKLPGLANMLNSPDDNRDSAYYSGNDASSKHTSTGSGMGVLSPAGSSFHTPPIDKTPSPTTTNNLLPQPLVSPVNSNMSVSSMISPTTPGSFHRPQSYDSAPSSATFAINGDIPEGLLRRESVDSKINQGFTDLRLGNPHSPYTSHNHSTSSIQNTLQQHRNPRPGFDSLAPHRISNGYQPSAERNPEAQPRMQRVAPAITGPTTSQIARAPEPTKGEAWAFPEEDIKVIPANVNAQFHHDSRRSSIAESLASSAYTTESRLPPGQRRLGESHEFQRLNASGEFPVVHHHSLQPRQVEDLQNEEAGSVGGGQPYSRTPELRISHKLAERKRRTEMKELFEQLRQLQPQDRGSKASKWEILTKAIAEHHRQQDQINSLTQTLQHVNASHAREINKLRTENEQLRNEMTNLRMELERIRSGAPAMNEPYVADAYTRRPELARPELPPLRGLHTSQTGGPESMAGVQYEPRVNGYRNPDPGRF